MNEKNALTKNVFVFCGSSLVLQKSAAPKAENAEVPGDKIPDLFFSTSGADYYRVSSLDASPDIGMLTLSPDFALPPDWELVPARSVLDSIAAGSVTGLNCNVGAAARLMRACHISQWRGESKYCGSCGTENGDSADETARLCPRCGRLEFPRITPAVITLVTNDKDEILLAHNKKFSAGVYSLIAGFNEAGERLEATVAREIREETGIEVSGIRYISSQPWPFPNSLMAGFTAHYLSGEVRPDGTEIEDVRWFTRDNLPLLPGRASISRYLIDLWFEGKL